MALTGLQIQKLLPKTNCKECGSNTCMAFAMKLAAKKADISQCPYISEEARQLLGAAAEPPVKGVALGPHGQVKLGQETVLYRHDKTFVNQTALAVNVNDTDPRESTNETLTAVKEYVLDRVGETMRVDLVSVTHKGADSGAFIDLAREAYEVTGKGLVLRCEDPEALAEAAVAVKGSGSLLASATAETAGTLVPLAKENGHALAITADNLDDLVALAKSVKESGFNELVLDFQTYSLAERFQTNSIARRAALKSNFKPLGYPSIRFVDQTYMLDVVVEAVSEIAKYGGICVLPSFDPAVISGLMTLRLNIFTDPQKPIQVEPKLYPIGEPTPESEVFVTTNFSLTYFIVSGEIENSGISAWLVVPECEGMSVLTAWAAGKFSGETIGKFCKEIDLDNQVSCRRMVIPGYVSQISGELEENMPGWSVLVGPQEAGDIESFVKAQLT